MLLNLYQQLQIGFSVKFFTTKIFAILTCVLLGLIIVNDNKVFKHLTVYVVVGFILLFYFKIIAPIIEDNLCLEKVKKLIMVHETALSIQRNRLITKDIFGN